MKRKSCGKAETTTGQFSHLAAIESDTFAAFPNLVAHLAVTRYDDGAARKPGEVKLKTAGAIWSGMLKDVDGGLFIPCNAPTLDDLLLMMEVLLGDEKAPWQPDQFAGGKKGKKA